MGASSLSFPDARLNSKDDLYTGGRPKEIVNIKMLDIRDRFILCKNYKVSRAIKEEKAYDAPP